MKKSTHITSAALPRRTHDFLVFRLGAQQYGIPLERVQQLCDVSLVDTSAATGTALVGALKLGTRYAPVHLPHACLHCALPAAGALNDVVVLQTASGAVGLAVDGVIDVVSFPEVEIKPAIDPAPPHPVTAVGGNGARQVLLLDPARLLAALYGGAAHVRLAA